MISPHDLMRNYCTSEGAEQTAHGETTEVFAPNEDVILRFEGTEDVDAQVIDWAELRNTNGELELLIFGVHRLESICSATILDKPNLPITIWRKAER
jgi:hypothetical protein